MTMESGIQIDALPNSPFGACVKLPVGVTDPSKLSELDFNVLKRALHENLVLVIPNQASLAPQSQLDLTRRFDPTCEGHYGHEQKIMKHNDSVLKKDGKVIPAVPEVSLVGNGVFPEGTEKDMGQFELFHPSNRHFHKEPLSEEQIANGQTRFYRWHMDAALYELAPPHVTTLLGITVPDTCEKSKIVYEDTKEELEVVKGATAFASGALAFDSLSEEDKQFALNTTVVYAPHPYIYISDCKATSDGLTMVSEKKERAVECLPQWEDSKLVKLPLVWKNPTTGRPHLQVHGCCVWKLVNNETGEVLEVEAAREKVHRLMRAGISPKNIYCHAWNQGDLAIFYNRGVWHSVTGEFPRDENRLMHQCNVASGEFPK